MDALCRKMIGFGLTVLLALIPLGCLQASSGSEFSKSPGADENFVAGENGIRFLPAELRFMEKLATGQAPEAAAPAFAAIADFSQQLKTQGVEVLVLPVPPKALNQASALGVSEEDQARLRDQWSALLANLKTQGVRVVDVEALTKPLADQEAMYCRRDTHWSGRGVVAAATALAEPIQALGLAQPPETNPTEENWKQVQIQGDLGGEGESVELMERSEPVGENRESPLLLLGDSHVLVFHAGADMHAAGAGLPEHLGRLTGVEPDVLGVRGSGADSARVALARRARGNPDYLKGKKVIVWCFAGREITESDGWKLIPILRP